MSDLLSGHDLAHLEDEIRHTDRILYVDKNDISGLSGSLKSLSLRTGWALYLWEIGRGLVNIKSSEPPAPKTESFKDAFKFALSRKHFSVFVFPVIDKEGWLQCKIFLSKQAPDSIEPVKFLFILPRDVEHRYFTEHCQKIEFNMGLDGDFVLRDGRWIRANEIP